jgi:hypothetical protein
MRWVCYAYYLMTHHYHHMIETPDTNLAKAMRQLHGVYTLCFNAVPWTCGPRLSGAL